MFYVSMYFNIALFLYTVLYCNGIEKLIERKAQKILCHAQKYCNVQKY